jgi:hypothetical protein
MASVLGWVGHQQKKEGRHLCPNSREVEDEFRFHYHESVDTSSFFDNHCVWNREVIPKNERKQPEVGSFHKGQTVEGAFVGHLL